MTCWPSALYVHWCNKVTIAVHKNPLHANVQLISMARLLRGRGATCIAHTYPQRSIPASQKGMKYVGMNCRQQDKSRLLEPCGLLCPKHYCYLYFHCLSFIAMLAQHMSTLLSHSCKICRRFITPIRGASTHSFNRGTWQITNRFFANHSLHAYFWRPRALHRVRLASIICGLLSFQTVCYRSDCRPSIMPLIQCPCPVDHTLVQHNQCILHMKSEATFADDHWSSLLEFSQSLISTLPFSPYDCNNLPRIPIATQENQTARISHAVHVIFGRRDHSLAFYASPADAYTSTRTQPFLPPAGKYWLPWWREHTHLCDRIDIDY